MLVAVRGGGIVLYTAPTTLAPPPWPHHPGPITLAPTAAVMGAAIETRLIPGAWALFSIGDQHGCLAAIAAVAAFARHPVVALARASMAPAVALARIIAQISAAATVRVPSVPA